MEVVHAFFEGRSLQKSLTHTNLILIPKKEVIQTFSDLRLISLRYFLNKVVSRVLHDKIEDIFPKLISQNQAGFVKGRSITENVLLALEIVTDIRKKGKPANVAIKLDMAKTYDMVDCRFLIKVLEKMDFNHLVVDKIWRLVANNQYSILINGQFQVFFIHLGVLNKEIHFTQHYL